MFYVIGGTRVTIMFRPWYLCHITRHLERSEAGSIYVNRILVVTAGDATTRTLQNTKLSHNYSNP